jgi:hypothetical protein
MFKIYSLLFSVLVTFTKPSYFTIPFNLIKIHKTTFFAKKRSKKLKLEDRKYHN